MTGQEPLTITKKELVHRIADETRQTKVVVKDVIQRFLDQIVAELVAGNRLEFREFGVFEIRQRASRVAQNPRTLKKVEVPAKRVVKFKAGRLMRLQIGGDDSDEPFDDEDEVEAPRAKPASQRAPSAPRATKSRGKSAEPVRPGPGAAPGTNSGASSGATSGPSRVEPPTPPVRPLPPPKPPSNSPF